MTPFTAMPPLARIYQNVSIWRRFQHYAARWAPRAYRLHNWLPQTIVRIDANGDAVVDFERRILRWILKENFLKLEKQRLLCGLHMLCFLRKRERWNRSLTVYSTTFLVSSSTHVQRSLQSYFPIFIPHVGITKTIRYAAFKRKFIRHFWFNLKNSILVIMKALPKQLLAKIVYCGLAVAVVHFWIPQRLHRLLCKYYPVLQLTQYSKTVASRCMRLFLI